MISIRIFRLNDLAGIIRIEKASFGIDAWPAALFRYYAGEYPALFYVAVVDRRIAGYGITCVTGETAEIVSIAVLPRYRGRRIARMLLRKTIAKAQRLGATSVWLMVRRDNLVAIQLYKSMGFARTITIGRYYEDGAAAWRMRMPLGAGRPA